MVVLSLRWRMALVQCHPSPQWPCSAAVTAVVTRVPPKKKKLHSLHTWLANDRLSNQASLINYITLLTHRCEQLCGIQDWEGTCSEPEPKLRDVVSHLLSYSRPNCCNGRVPWALLQYYGSRCSWTVAWKTSNLELIILQCQKYLISECKIISN